MEWLHSFERLLAVIGGVALIASPFAMAYLRFKTHEAVPTAPAFLELKAEVERVTRWQDDHAEDVKMIPRLAVILENVEEALRELKKVVERIRE